MTPTLCVGAGANYILFDPHLNRLYVTNPANGMVYVFSDTGGANDTPIQLKAISFASGSAPCPAGCTPTSVTALPDGSRFYVASYQIASACPDPTVTGRLRGSPASPFLTPTVSRQVSQRTSLTLLSWSRPAPGPRA